MKYKVLIIISSIAVALFIMSNGYSFWQKNLTIKGNITVVEPPKEEGNLQIPLNQPSDLSTTPTLDLQPPQADSSNSNNGEVPKKEEDNIAGNNKDENNEEDLKEDKGNASGENKGNNDDGSSINAPESSNEIDESHQESSGDTYYNESNASNENTVKEIENSADDADLNKN